MPRWFTAPTVSWFPAEFTILPAYRNSFSFAIIRFCPDSIHCLLLNISPFRPRWIVIVPIVVLVLVIDEGNSTVKTHNTTRIAHNAVWLYINVSCLHDCLIYWEKTRFTLSIVWEKVQRRMKNPPIFAEILSLFGLHVTIAVIIHRPILLHKTLQTYYFWSSYNNVSYRYKKFWIMSYVNV